MANRKTHVPIDFNHAAIIRAFNTDVDCLCRALEDYNLTPPEKLAVTQWFRSDRMKIASAWLARVAYVALRSKRLKFTDLFIANHAPSEPEKSDGETREDPSDRHVAG